MLIFEGKVSNANMLPGRVTQLKLYIMFAQENTKTVCLPLLIVTYSHTRFHVLGCISIFYHFCLLIIVHVVWNTNLSVIIVQMCRLT